MWNKPSSRRRLRGLSSQSALVLVGILLVASNLFPSSPSVREAARETMVVVNEQASSSTTSARFLTSMHSQITSQTPLWKAMDALSMDLTTWRNYLKEATIERSHSYRAGTVYDEDCGFSVRLKLDHTASSSWQLVFLKHAATNYTDYWMETHLREIKASHLDRLLGTNLTPPVVGKRIPYQTIHDSFVNVGGAVTQTRENLFNATRCAMEGSAIPAAAMFNVPGVTASYPPSLVEEAARTFNTSKSVTTESALTYAVFNYLAGCLKTNHNHFWLNNQRFVSIDNDRCFQSKELIATIEEKDRDLIQIWEQIVFDTCTFPDALVRALETTENVKLSNRLKRSLRDDDLADDLLREQPEAIDEIDGRAERLLRHMRACQNRRDVAID